MASARAGADVGTACAKSFGSIKSTVAASFRSSGDLLSTCPDVAPESVTVNSSPTPVADMHLQALLPCAQPLMGMGLHFAATDRSPSGEGNPYILYIAYAWYFSFHTIHTFYTANENRFRSIIMRTVDEEGPWNLKAQAHQHQRTAR